MAVHERAAPESRRDAAIRRRSRSADLGLRQVALSDLDEPTPAGDRRRHDLDQIASLRLAPIGHKHDGGSEAGPGGWTGVDQRPGSRPAWTRLPRARRLGVELPRHPARQPGVAARQRRVAHRAAPCGRDPAARATAVLSRTASAPSSKAMATSEAVPTPASTIDRHRARLRISSMLCGFRMPSPEPIGAPSGITAAHPRSSRRFAITGSSFVYGRTRKPLATSSRAAARSPSTSGRSVSSSAITSSLTRSLPRASRAELGGEHGVARREAPGRVGQEVEALRAERLVEVLPAGAEPHASDGDGDELRARRRRARPASTWRLG